MSDRYRNLFPVDGKTFDTGRGSWQARLTNDPDPVHIDRVRYVIEFQSLGASGSERRFTLWLGVRKGPSAKLDMSVTVITPNLTKRRS